MGRYQPLQMVWTVLAFTMRVMEKFGVSLPHYSGSQAQMGKKVSSANMQPGDPIFYAGSNGKGKPRSYLYWKWPHRTCSQPQKWY